MRRAVIVVGCSYGDEGKGLATAFSAGRLGGRCLDILMNGGAQRGHTVDLPDGRRHVFHHFGSAALQGAMSCADEAFIVNPLVYREEREALKAAFGLTPALMICGRCRVSTSWDMMLGQIIEENRGAARHGSCGLGIQETRLRFMHTDWCLDWGRLSRLDAAEYRDYCLRIAREYLPERLRSLGMSADARWQSLIGSPGLIEHSFEDLRYMREHAQMYDDWRAAAEGYDALIFELGQGLALDCDNRADFPHLTPSHTTSLESARRIAALPGGTQTQVIYVTRSYLTRHGAGPLPTECPMGDIGQDIVDRTNVPNPHQQALRFGYFDGPAIRARVDADLAATRGVLPGAEAAVLVTHLNETGGRLAGDAVLSEFTRHFDRAYVSHDPCGVEEVSRTA